MEISLLLAFFAMRSVGTATPDILHQAMAKYPRPLSTQGTSSARSGTYLTPSITFRRTEGKPQVPQSILSRTHFNYDVYSQTYQGFLPGEWAKNNTRMNPASIPYTVYLPYLSILPAYVSHPVPLASGTSPLQGYSINSWWGAPPQTSLVT